MEAYAGKFVKEDMIKQSASGGAATAIATAIIRNGGVVYGVKYSSDFYFVEYGLAETVEELDEFKGSKYSYANRYVKRNGEKVSVFCDVIEQLKNGKKVLFFGLGCNTSALKKQVKKADVDDSQLYTVELLCDGVTGAEVHENYVKELESKFGSKVMDFSLRYKKDGWRPFYIRAVFENGEEYVRLFAESDYGFAFDNYKKWGCYNCLFKNDNHQGDLILADYWGCMPGMKTYHPQGVSLFLVQSDKGKKLMNMIDSSEFICSSVDVDYALHYNQRYFTPHEKYLKWEMFDTIMKEKGLHEAVIACAGIRPPAHFTKGKTEVVLWGTGECFRKYLPAVKELCRVKYVVDSDKKMWGKEVDPGIVCISPEELKKIKVGIVVIMIEKSALVMQVANDLLDRGISQFDCVHNWIYYGEMLLKE